MVPFQWQSVDTTQAPSKTVFYPRPFSLLYLKMHRSKVSMVSLPVYERGCHGSAEYVAAVEADVAA